MTNETFNKILESRIEKTRETLSKKSKEYGLEATQEMVDEKIGDAINYHCLLEAIFHEEREQREAEVRK